MPPVMGVGTERSPSPPIPKPTMLIVLDDDNNQTDTKATPNVNEDTSSSPIFIR